MRILHIGGYLSSLKTLADFQISLGHSVNIIAPWKSPYGLRPNAIKVVSQETFSEILNYAPEIIHFHDHTTLQVENVDNELQILDLLARNSKLLLSCREMDLVHPEREAIEKMQQRIVKDYFSYIFLKNPGKSIYSELGKPCSFLADWVDPKEVIPQTKAISEPLKALLISDLPNSHGNLEILNTVEKINSKHSRLVIIEVSSEDLFQNPEHFFGQVDIVIEGLNLKTYRTIGLQAMLRGKTLLSGNDPKCSDHWEALKFSPVQNITSENLRAKLDSILQEPRCCRDFAKRTRQYVEKYHDVRLIGQVILGAYERLLKQSHGSQAAEILFS